MVLGVNYVKWRANLEAMSGDFNGKRLKFLVAMFDCVMMERAGPGKVWFLRFMGVEVWL